MSARPSITTLLEGAFVETTHGYIGFCAVNLVRAFDSTGGERRIVLDCGHVGRRPALASALKREGLSPTDVDQVILTHAHWDHVQNVDMFDNAEVVIAEPELRYVQHPHPNDWATPPWTSSILPRTRTRPVSDGEQLALGVEVMYSPGHSAGSMTVLVAAQDGLHAFSGDALPTAESAQRGLVPLAFWSASTGNRSLSRILDVADVVHPGHDRPFRFERGEVEYEEPFHYDIVGVRGDEDGLSLSGRPPFSQWVMSGADN